MAKLTQFSNSVQITDGLSPKNGADFPLMEAHSIVVDYDDENNEIRLDEKLESLEQAIANSGGSSGGDSNTNSGGATLEGLDANITVDFVNAALSDYETDNGSIEDRLAAVETPLGEYPADAASIADRLTALESGSSSGGETDSGGATIEGVTIDPGVINAALAAYDPNNTRKRSIESRLNTLENQLSDLNYKPIDITSFTCNVSTAMREVGDSVSNVVLSWRINRTPTQVTLDSKQVANSMSSSYTDTSTITTNKTWRLEVKDGTKSSDSASLSINFGYRVYYGVSDSDQITEELVEGLNSTITGSRLSSIAETAENEYIYYAHPTSFGTCEFWDGKTNGLAKYNFAAPETINITNSYGKTISYYVYRSKNLANESASIEIR